MKIRASICISTFNKPSLLKTTLASIYSQSPGFNFETIVVDDGSADGKVREVCREFPVRYNRIDRPPVFRNPCVARNVAYRLAASDIIIAQSDEVLHVTPNTIQYLVEDLCPGQFLMANVFCLSRDGKIDGYFVGPKRQVPFFFLGSMWREDLYAVGGNDEEFVVAPAWEDQWFGDCLINGRGITPVYSTAVVGHHQWHEYCSRPETETASRDLYEKKFSLATRGELAWQSAAGAWPFVPASDLTNPSDVVGLFTEVYEKNSWGCEESRSGFGSTLDATTVIRREIPVMLRELGIKSLLDAPCGDCNWTQSMDLDGLRYVGADIVGSMIEDVRGRHPDWELAVADVLKDDLPRCDAILCRDCLQHFSPGDALLTVQNFRASGAEYLLATTFTRPDRENRPIQTGSWSPYNLQKPPFNWPPPVACINEGCQEWFPNFNDKSLGVWKLIDLERALFPTRSLVVCVEYDDFLAVTLDHNRRLFTDTLVITSPDDHRTQELAARLSVRCHITDAFYRDGASFNKGAAVEEGFDVLGREGWICVWDADIILPREIYFKRDDRALYSPKRVLLTDLSPESVARRSNDESWDDLPCPTQPHEFDGFTHLFHAAAIPPPWYGTRWRHAGGCDSDFEFRFSEERRMRPPWKVLHLGGEGMPEIKTRVGRNWCGRVTPRIDDGSSPASARTRESVIKRIVRDRSRHGTSGEMVCQSTKPAPAEIPRRASFFWAGRMSWLRYLTLQSFRKFNPAWEMVLYSSIQDCTSKTWETAEDSDNSYAGDDWTDRVSDLGVRQEAWDCPLGSVPPAHASDVLTWHVLAGVGGLYCDMDVLWLRPIEDLHERYRRSSAMFCLESGYLAVGLLASSPGCQVFKDALQMVQNIRTYQGNGTDLLYRLANAPRRDRNDRRADGVRAVESLRNKYPSERITDVVDGTIYPYDWRHLKEIFARTNPVPKSLGVHWFGGDARSQPWINLLTPDTYKYRTNTLTKCIEEVIR
jgi:hypothetical protein